MTNIFKATVATSSRWGGHVGSHMLSFYQCCLYQKIF